jgi:hypothetical protein
MRGFFDFENHLVTLIDIPETWELVGAILEAASSSHRNVRASFNGYPHLFRTVENRRENRIPESSKSFKMSVNRWLALQVLGKQLMIGR